MCLSLEMRHNSVQCLEAIAIGSCELVNKSKRLVAK